MLDISVTLLLDYKATNLILLMPSTYYSLHQRLEFCCTKTQTCYLAKFFKGIEGLLVVDDNLVYPLTSIQQVMHQYGDCQL